MSVLRLGVIFIFSATPTPSYTSRLETSKVGKQAIVVAVAAAALMPPDYSLLVVISFAWLLAASDGKLKPTDVGSQGRTQCSGLQLQSAHDNYQ